MAVAYIAEGARTPIGRLGGSLSSLTAAELGAIAIVEALRRSGISPSAVDRVVMGQVLQAGQGQNPARQAAVGAGIAMDVPAVTVNKVCLSGLYALHVAQLMIAAGEADVVVAGGMESMSKAPFLLNGAREGLRFGDTTMFDAITSDGLTCSFDHEAMGAATERYALAADISRAEMDSVAVRSHERSAAATAAGRLGEEIVAVPIARRGKEPLEVLADEGIRAATSAEQLAALRPAFSTTGSVTAGNASQLSDGAAALVVMSDSAAQRLGIEPLGEILAYGEVAGPDPSLLTQPSRAIGVAARRAGVTADQLDLVEVNEAFAAVAIASQRELALPDDVVNVNGGAIALGHPIGMSGTRLALTLLYELRRRGGGLGAAALCGGGGQGDAVVLRVTPKAAPAR